MKFFSFLDMPQSTVSSIIARCECLVDAKRTYFPDCIVPAVTFDGGGIMLLDCFSGVGLELLMLQLTKTAPKL